MISVDNFYWVLYENLLRPLKIDARYYYPFGTQDNLSIHEFEALSYRCQLNHVLFYDQEPIWMNSLGEKYISGIGTEWSHYKWVKILANSEHSYVKKQLCKKNYMLDWYFFYHGFAALDWYRDAQYIRQDHYISNAFISCNHIIAHNRSYRIALLARLIHRDIVRRGLISWHPEHNATMQEIENPYNFLSDQSRMLCRDVFQDRVDLPWRIDNTIINGHLSAHFGHQEYRLWQHSLLHVINETVFYQSKLHLTEKIFKPIVAQRPFILVAAPGNLAYLRSYGFQTFAPWIDESYDDIQDPDQRLDAVANEVAKFAAMSVPELRRIHQDMQSVLAYNKRHFFNEFRDIIVNELVDNFDQCIRIWNNGRVDGRELPLHPDLDQVKKILLA
jgi:hypothetical protein